MPEQRTWRSILIEAGVIVGSILLAFAIDAGWDARGEASRRRAVIDGLVSDFAAVRADLDRVAGFHAENRAAAAGLMELGSRGPVPDATAHLADSLFAAAVLGGSFDAPLGTLQSLINAGDLDLIGDPELAAMLTSFPGLVSDLDREQAWMRELMLEMYRYLASIGVGAEMGLSDPYWDLSWEIPGGSIHGIAHTPGFRTWIGGLWQVYGNTTEDLRAIDASLTVIEASLAALR